MEQENVNIVGPQLAAEAIQIGTNLIGGSGSGLCEDGYSFAWDTLERLTNMGMGTVLICSIPTGHALIGCMTKQRREAGDSQFPALVRVSTPAARACAYKHSRNGNLAESEHDTIGCAFS
jgi:hypothetical protein